MFKRLFRTCTFLVAFVAFAVLATNSANAQFGGGGFGGGGGGFGGGGGGFGGGGGGGGGAGIVVSPDGVLKRATNDPTGRLTQQRLAAAKKDLGAVAHKHSELRMISLNRLEEAVREQQLKNNVLNDEVKFLAGLTRAKYVFFLPESNDIVIAGPAEPFFQDGEGEIRGLHSGRPVIQLTDLVVALRTFAPGRRAPAQVGCSIDPTQEGLARMQQFLKTLRPQPTNAFGQFVANGLQQSLGPQVVRVDGIAPGTRFAHVMVSADYRMKLIGIGLEKPAVKITTYISAARSQEGLVRWFFTPDYETVRVSDDHFAMELVGDGVKLVGEDEVVNADGTRRAVGKTTGASKKFVDSFTRQYSALSAKEPVYAHLRNLIDLTIAAAYIQQQDFYGQAGWNMEFFADENNIKTEFYAAPKTVATAANAVWKGSKLLTPVGGGVDIQPTLALATDRLLPDENGELKSMRDEIDVSKLEKGNWWWDAKPIK